MEIIDPVAADFNDADDNADLATNNLYDDDGVLIPSADPAAEPTVPATEPATPAPAVEPAAPAAEPPPSAVVEPTPAAVEQKPILIPKAVMDGKVRKERAKAEEYRRQLDELRAQQAEASVVSVDDAALNQLGELLVEGKTAEFATAMRSLLTTAVTQATTAAKATAQIETIEQTRATNFDDVVNELLGAYPELDNTNSETYNNDLTVAANEYMDLFAAQGYDSAAALRKAVTLVAAENGLVNRTQTNAKAEVTPAPAPSPAPASKPAANGDAIQKKLDAAAAQPAVLPTRGTSEEPTATDQFLSMTDEEYDALPPSRRRELERLMYGA